MAVSSRDTAISRSLSGHELIEVQQHAGDGRPIPAVDVGDPYSGSLRSARSWTRTRSSVCDSRGPSAVVPGRGERHAGSARDRSRARVDRCRIRAARPLGDLDERRVVEQRQGLERRVGAEPPRAGLHAARARRRSSGTGAASPARRTCRARGDSGSGRYRPATGASSGPGSSRPRAGAERRSARRSIASSSPLLARAASRISSASRRSRACRQSKRLSGSIAWRIGTDRRRLAVRRRARRSGDGSP